MPRNPALPENPARIVKRVFRVQEAVNYNMVKKAFRTCKNDDLVRMMPLRQWTDSKIRCHVLTCMIALSYLRLIEIRMQRANVKMSAATVMKNLHQLNSCLVWKPNQKTPVRIIEEPTERQEKILRALGYTMKAGGVLQKLPK